MSLRDMSDEELLGDIHSMEQAIAQYQAEVNRRVLAQSEAQPPTEPTDATIEAVVGLLVQVVAQSQKPITAETLRDKTFGDWAVEVIAAAHRTQEGRNDD